MNLNPAWEYVADTVMGGVSTGHIETAVIDGRSATRLIGAVSLENNGGFVQMAFDTAPAGGTLDASGFQGIEMDVYGNEDLYDLRLRTDQLTRPWQSFRAAFTAPKQWKTLRIPFTRFDPHRTDVAFDPARLRRIGVLAIGREFQADIAVSRIGLY